MLPRIDKRVSQEIKALYIDGRDEEEDIYLGVSDSESHILELVDRARIHDIEIVLSWREIFWDLDSCDLIAYYLELCILEDEIITELDRYDFFKTISLDDDESVDIIVESFGSDVRDIYESTRMLECETDIGRQNLPAFECEKYEIFPACESIALYLNQYSTTRVYRLDPLLSDIYKLYALHILPIEHEKIIDIGIVSCPFCPYERRLSEWSL